MSITANSLKNNEEQKKAIAKEVTHLLGHIDDELKVAHSSGKHMAHILVPSIFAIPYMNNADSQRCVYYKILASLLDRGFHVKIKMSNNTTLFIVSWLSEDEQKQVEIQLALIARHTEKSMKMISADLSKP